MELIQQGIAAISSGNLDTSIHLGRQDEWRTIETALNKMASDLKMSYSQLEEHSKDLEEKVNQRTQDLQQRMECIQLLQEVATAANSAATLEEVLQASLDNICRLTRWPVGHAYVLADDGTDDLLPTGIWHVDHPDQWHRFRAMTEAGPFSFHMQYR